MLQHPHLVHPRQQKHYATQHGSQSHHYSQQRHHSHQSHQSHPITSLSDNSMGSDVRLVASGSSDMHKHKRSVVGQYLAQQASFSSSEEELHSTSEYDGK